MGSTNSKRPTVNRTLAPVYKPLIKPARYKILKGGRGSGKSHTFAELLIGRAYEEYELRWACIREVQNSIKESVRQLLVDKIQDMGIGRHFEVLEGEIRSDRGGKIIFRGMNHFNAENIKSLEGYDGAWWEEAQTAREKSIRLLRPTIRKEGSELWFSYNPRHETDPIDILAHNPPPNSIVITANYSDNPRFPAVLQEEMEHDYATDPEMAEHVWGGGYELITERSYYARLLKTVEDEGRIGEFPYNPRLPIDTSWDIGVHDYTAIWFIQTDGSNVYVVDFWETQNDGADQVLADALPEYTKDIRARYARIGELGRPQAFTYRTHFFPHDIAVREWGAGAKERSQVLVELGVPIASIHRGAAADPADRVQAVRELLPRVHFNDTPRVRAGLTRLRRYSRRWNEALGTYTGPLKDGNDHAADAFGEYAINSALRPPTQKKKISMPTPEELARIPLTVPEAL